MINVLYATVAQRVCLNVIIKATVRCFYCVSSVFSRRAMPRRGLLNLPFVTFLVGTKCSFRHTPTELTADGDIAVLPADIRFHRVAPRFPVDAGYVAARVARTVQHRRQIWPERVPMRVLIRPPLARQTAGRYVYCTSVVTPVVLIAVH